MRKAASAAFFCFLVGIGVVARPGQRAERIALIGVDCDQHDDSPQPELYASSIGCGALFAVYFAALYTPYVMLSAGCDAHQFASRHPNFFRPTPEALA